MENQIETPVEEAPAKVAKKKTVRECLTANHGNTLALLACLEACNVKAEDALPYRDVEESLLGKPALSISIQSPHTLLGLLVDCGGIAKVEVAEETPADEGEPQDKPVDYLLHITDEGRDALEEFSCPARLARLMLVEPEGYLDAYATVFDTCQGEGAKLSQIEAALAGHPALTNPKRVYPGYFVSKLEGLGAIEWAGVWKATAAGEEAFAAL